MVKRIFLDTNVVLDLVLNRPEFANEAEQIFNLNNEGEIQLFISALTLADVIYFTNKNGKNPVLVAKTLLEWVQVVDLEVRFFHQTLTSAFKDFEDGLQYFCASSIQGLDGIVTRNKKDFKPSIIPVHTPVEFLESL